MRFFRNQRRRHVRRAHARGRARRRHRRAQPGATPTTTTTATSTCWCCAAAGWARQGRFPLSLLRNDGDGTLRRRDRGGGAAALRADADRRLASTSTATAGSTCSSATSREIRTLDGRRAALPVPSSSATTATARSPTWRQGVGVDVVGFVKGVVGRRLRQRRPARPLRLGMAAAPNRLLPQRRARGRAGAWRFTRRRRPRPA